MNPLADDATVDAEAAQRDLRDRVVQSGVAALVRLQLAGLRAHLDALRREAAALGLEVVRLRAQREELALALGACSSCFGDDAACPRCAGRGAPGSEAPDPARFERWVAPAVRGKATKGPARDLP